MPAPTRQVRRIADGILDGASNVAHSMVSGGNDDCKKWGVPIKALAPVSTAAPFGARLSQFRLFHCVSVIFNFVDEKVSHQYVGL